MTSNYLRFLDGQQRVETGRYRNASFAHICCLSLLVNQNLGVNENKSALGLLTSTRRKHSLRLANN